MQCMIKVVATMTLEPYVHQLFLGKVKEVGKKDAIDPMDRLWTTGMFKEPTSEKVWLSETGLQGDEVGDKKNHGGQEKALFAYPIGHYRYWREIEQIDMHYGGFGENMAVLEMDEFSVFIGDIYQFGDAIIQVSQPRNPCWRPARRYRRKELALQIQNTGKTGWYFRVLKPGYVWSKVDLELKERPYPQWSIAAANEVMHHEKHDLVRTDELSRCEGLAPGWREKLQKRLRSRESSIEKRVYGPNIDA